MSIPRYDPCAPDDRRHSLISEAMSEWLTLAVREDTAAFELARRRLDEALAPCGLRKTDWDRMVAASVAIQLWAGGLL